MMNPKLPTGTIELRVQELTVLNKSKTPPFEPGGENLPNEELRLQYRFIDLRRTELQENDDPAAQADEVSPRLLRRTRASSKSKPRCSAAARRKGRATISFPAACIPAASMPCRSRRSSTNRF